MRIPRATYRLQLNAQFTFKDAEALLDYFSALGISDLYLSPINTAPPESTHNYDVWDYGEINPTLGGRAGLQSLSAAAKARDIGLLVDFVPNHMGVAGNGNRWWRDVLQHGPSSEFAECFDIHWQCENGIPKVRLPVLGDFRETVLNRGEIHFEGGQLAYYEHRFPIAPGTKVEGDPVETLQRQHYRLIHWQHGTEQINYRRFFEVNTLAGVAVERSAVFKRVHALLIELSRNGTITGVRLDHIDGLACPNRYLAALAESVGDVYVLVEKILAPDERLPKPWRVQGTSGYDFLIEVGQLWIDSTNEGRFTELYRSLAPEARPFDEIVAGSKREVLRILFYSEFQALLRRALGLVGMHPLYCDLSPRSVEGALESLIVRLPVYRTYAVCGESLSEADRKVIEFAARASREHLAAFFHPAIDFLVEIWTTDFGGDEGDTFRTKLQQLSGPVMAKGTEDTAFYRYHRFIALNEVGGEPQRFGVEVSEFHERSGRRAREYPHSMLATSTHDTKFSEDVRARLSVLSEIPVEWERFLEGWRGMSGETPLRANDEYRFVQALVGVWPNDFKSSSLPEELTERLLGFVRKSLREAKVQTSWLEPNEKWENVVFEYVRRVCSSSSHCRHVSALVECIGPYGALNSLSQTLIKLTAPGVPDIYQANELWDFSLVDPDNRRPVDYIMRGKLLAELAKQSPAELLRDWRTGAIKMKVTRDTLRFRKEHPALFADGTYVPVVIDGELARHCVAFKRTDRDHEIVVAVPRFCVKLGFPPKWKDTRLLASGPWVNLFTDETVASADLSDVFRSFPVALLVKENS